MPLGTQYLLSCLGIMLAGLTSLAIWGWRGFGCFAGAGLLLGGLNDPRERWFG